MVGYKRAKGHGVMEYLKLQLRDTGEINWARANMHMRGVLVTLLLRCALLENDGCIEGCREWSNADWQAAFGVRRKDADALVRALLAEWDGGDLELSMYDHIGQQRLETQRQQGIHGSKGGRKHKETGIITGFDRGKKLDQYRLRLISLDKESQ